MLSNTVIQMQNVLAATGERKSACVCRCECVYVCERVCGWKGESVPLECFSTIATTNSADL